MFKKNNLRFGLILGITAPLISLVVYYFIRFYPLFSVGDFFRFMGENKAQITAITVPCLILNIALFTLYINTNRDQTAKGIFAVTLVLAIASLVIKFLI